MTAPDLIALTALRATSKAAAEFLDGIALDLAKDVDKDVPQAARLDAIAYARTGARILREAALSMRELMHALDIMEDEANPK